MRLLALIPVAFALILPASAQVAQPPLKSRIAPQIPRPGPKPIPPITDKRLKTGVTTEPVGTYVFCSYDTWGKRYEGDDGSGAERIYPGFNGRRTFSFTFRGGGYVDIGSGGEDNIKMGRTHIVYRDGAWTIDGLADSTKGTFGFSVWTKKPTITAADTTLAGTYVTDVNGAKLNYRIAGTCNLTSPR